MNIIYLINSKEYNYHSSLADTFNKVIPGKVINVNDYEDPSEGYREIKQSNPEVIITFDLAGHVFRTGMDELTLNALPCRIANILFQKRNSYGVQIKKRENLSTFMYISANDDVLDARKYLEEVPNIDSFPEIEYKNRDISSNQDNIKAIEKWWDSFKRDAMIDEDTDI